LFTKIANAPDIECDPKSVENVQNFEVEIDAEAENKNLFKIFTRFQEVFVVDLTTRGRAVKADPSDAEPE
jgi:hypothetical protein